MTADDSMEKLPEHLSGGGNAAASHRMIPLGIEDKRMKAPQMTTSLTSSICKAFFSAVTLIVFSVYLLCVTIPSLVKVDNTVMADNKSLHRESAATSDGCSDHSILTSNAMVECLGLGFDVFSSRLT